jgi:hypothetical protein
MESFIDEQLAILPLPLTSVALSPARCVPSASVSRRSLVKLDGAAYSVWSTWAGLDVTVYLDVDETVLVSPDGSRVVHPRQPFGGRAIDYRHYIHEFARKPRALWQVAGSPIPCARRAVRCCVAVARRLARTKQAARVFAQVLWATIAQVARDTHLTRPSYGFRGRSPRAQLRRQRSQCCDSSHSSSWPNCGNRRRPSRMGGGAECCVGFQRCDDIRKWTSQSLLAKTGEQL